MRDRKILRSRNCSFQVYWKIIFSVKSYQGFLFEKIVFSCFLVVIQGFFLHYNFDLSFFRQGFSAEQIGRWVNERTDVSVSSRFLGGAPTSICHLPSVRPSLRISVRPSIAHHISGPVQHLVIILVHMCKMKISLGVFFIFVDFWFFGLLEEGKSAKNRIKWKITITCVTCHISGTV